MQDEDPPTVLGVEEFDLDCRVGKFREQHAKAIPVVHLERLVCLLNAHVLDVADADTVVD